MAAGNEDQSCQTPSKAQKTATKIESPTRHANTNGTFKPLEMRTVQIETAGGLTPIDDPGGTKPTHLWDQLGAREGHRTSNINPNTNSTTILLPNPNTNPTPNLNSKSIEGTTKDAKMDDHQGHRENTCPSQENSDHKSQNCLNGTMETIPHPTQPTWREGNITQGILL